MAAMAGGFEAASFNQTPPFENIDLFATDLALREALARAGVDHEAAIICFRQGFRFGRSDPARVPLVLVAHMKKRKFPYLKSCSPSKKCTPSKGSKYPLL
jgi:hypothetical protein